MAALTGAISVKVMALVLVKVLTIVLPKHDYGLYALWMSFVILVSTFSTSAFSATLWRFMPQRRKLETIESASELFMTAITGGFAFLLTSVALFSVLDLIGLRIVDDQFYLTTLVIVGFLAATYVLRELVLVVSGSEQSSQEVLAFNLAYGGVSTVFAGFIGLAFRDYRLVLVGLSLGYAVPVVTSLAIKLRQYGSRLPKLSDFKKSLGFGGPSILVGSVKTLVPFLASFIVGHWIGIPEVATLSIAIVVGGILSFVVGPPQTAYQAYIVNAYETGNYDKGQETATTIIELFLMISAPVAFSMIAMSPLLVHVFSTEQYIDATILIPFTVLSAVLVAFSYFWKIQLDLVEKPHLTGFTYLASVAPLVVVAMLLIPAVGLLGIGVAIVSQSGFVAIVLLIIGNSQLPIRQRSRFWIGWVISILAMVSIFQIAGILGIPDIVSTLIALGGYLLVIRITGLMSIQRARTIISLLISRSVSLEY
jgi:O-antigen/teichoic acid export membrane protein